MDAAKFEKIVLMLSSDQPGEVFAAAQAIGRALPDAKLDWHKFAKLVAGRLGHEPRIVEPRTEYTGEHRAGNEISQAEVGILVLLNGSLRHKLREREREFVESMYAKHQEYGRRTKLSPAQRKWLQDIWEKIG